MAKKPVILQPCSTDEPNLGLDEQAPSPAPAAEQKPRPVEPAPVPPRGSTRPTGTKGTKGTKEPKRTETPAIMEFKPVDSTALWRVEKFDLLAAEFGLEATDLPQFQFFCQQHPRLWLLVRRIYGLAAVIPSAETHPDDLRVWTRGEMEAEGYEVATDLEALRALWMDHIKREAKEPEPPTPPPASKGELELDDRLLEQFGFSERLFKISVYDPLANGGKGGPVPRAQKENMAERAWFIGRVKDWSKMLSDSIGGPLARSALMNEMTMRRLEAEIAVAEPNKRGALYEQKSAEVNEYKAAVEDLQKMFPELAVAGKEFFRRWGLLGGRNCSRTPRRGVPISDPELG